MDYRNFCNEKVSLLGFGTMRFPLKEDESIDYNQVNEMFDYAIENGVNYFDTAYIYHGGTSEVAVRECLVKRYPRDKFFIANKLALWLLQKPEDCKKMFDTQLERCGVDFFDFYLLHAYSRGKMENIRKSNAIDFVKKMKEEGKIKHIGFSFHDNFDAFKEFFDEVSDFIEFVQLQINYQDFEPIESKKCYDYASSKGIPVVIMEPVRGGSLATFGEKIDNMFYNRQSEHSVASWAVRYAGSFDMVMTVLSGMSNMAQVVDNVKTMKNFKYLTKDDYKFLDTIIDEYTKLGLIKCTKCDYCIECPKGIKISKVFEMYNDSKQNPSNKEKNKSVYSTIYNKNAMECIKCKKCENVCPQKLPIIDNLKISHDELV